MDTEGILVLVFWLAVMCLWAMSIWGGWAERHYDRVGGSSVSWFWLRQFGVATTKENCVRFSKRVSLVGMAVVTIGVAVLLVFKA